MGLLVFLLCLCFAEMAALAQDFSDMFAGRQNVGGTSAVITGSNSNATIETFEPKHAGKRGGHSVWVSWTATDNGLLTLTTKGSTFDTLLGVYALHGGNDPELRRLNEVADDDDDDGQRALTSYLSVGVTSNRTYQIAVDGFNGATGDILLKLNFLSSSNLQPTVVRRPGDQALRIGDPLILSVGIARVKDMDLAWYLNGRRIPGEESNPTLVIPSLQRTNLGFYSVRLELNDDDFFSAPVEVQVNSEGQSEVLARYKMADAAQSGLVRKLGGGFGVTLGYNGTQIFNTTNSIADPNAPTICGVVGGAPYWFSYQAPTNGTMTVDTSGSSFNTMLGVFTYDGVLYSYTNLVTLVCDTVSGTKGDPSSVQFQAETGRKYFIVVDGIGGARGIAHLNYALDPNLPPRPPVITKQPESLAVSRRTAVALSVVADSADPVAYQWQHDGSILAQQTNASLLLTSPQKGDAGDYTVVVTNVAGAITSTPARISIISAPMITIDNASNWLISAFPGTRGYQYSADCSVGGSLGIWWPWTNAFPDYGGIIWLTNEITGGGALFLRVHSP